MQNKVIYVLWIPHMKLISFKQRFLPWIHFYSVMTVSFLFLVKLFFWDDQTLIHQIRDSLFIFRWKPYLWNRMGIMVERGQAFRLHLIELHYVLVLQMLNEQFLRLSVLWVLQQCIKQLIRLWFILSELGYYWAFFFFFV